MSKLTNDRIKKAGAGSGALLFEQWLLPAASLLEREFIRFFRERNRVLGALATPLVFWLLIGSGLDASFRPPSAGDEVSYFQYFYPGTLALILLFTSIFSTISIIEDRREGFLQAVLVAPIPRASLVLGKVLGGTALALVQGLIFLLLAPVVGIAVAPLELPLIAAPMFIVAFGLTSLGFTMAWRSESTQGFHAVMNLLLMPMWLLSGALFPASGAAGWLRWVMMVNPLTYGVAVLRYSLHLSQPEDLPSRAMSLGITLLFGLGAFAAAIAIAGRQEES